MIKVHFFDWNSNDLDVEHEMGIHMEADDFLVQNVPGIRLDSTDNQFDLDNNWIFWFYAENESKAVQAIHDILTSMVKPDSGMKFIISIESYEP